MEKEVFAEELNKLLEFAHSKENTLDIQDINDYFKNESLNEQQLEEIYAFLESKDIDVLHVMTDELTPEESIS